VPDFSVQEPYSSSPQQWFDTQSVADVQVLPFAHLGQLVPPQSTALSPWFFLRSMQLTQVPASQAPLAQSAPVLHALPSAQRPQSRAVPQPSVTFPHCVPQTCGVQHWLLKHTSGLVQFSVQSSEPPQPSATLAAQAFAGHALIGVQQLVW
jgi:hypothetical protein